MRTLRLAIVIAFGLWSAVLAQPKVALILGGGAARGMAHIGVLRALNEAGVPVDLIVGTSMGSVIGAMYAAGYSTEVLEELAVRIDPGMVVRFHFPIDGGLLDASPLETALEVLTEGAQVGATPVPYYLVASNLRTGEAQLFTSGSLARAVHASMAMPVLMEPVEVDGEWYYDGAYKAPVPVRMARELGAEVVIVVNVTREVPFRPESLIDNVTQLVIDIIRRNSEADLAAADAIVDPGLALESYMSFDKARAFIGKGYAATRARLPEIYRVLEAHGIPLRPPGDPNQGRAINRGWRERLERARAAVERMPPRFSVLPVVGLAPASYLSGRHPDATPALSLFKLGARAGGGPLRRGHLEAWYATNLEGAGGAVGVSAAWNPLPDWLLGIALARDVGGRWSVEPSLRYDGLPGAEVGLRLDPIRSRLRLEAAWRRRGAYALSGGYTRGWAPVFDAVDLDARVRRPLGWGLELRGRAYLAATGAGAPQDALFSLGARSLLRGYPSDAWTAPAVGVLNLELAWTPPHGSPVLETALVKPSFWGFVDAGAAPARFPGAAVGLGVGAGVEAQLFGFLPVQGGFDLAYGLRGGGWGLGFRGRLWP